MAKMTKSPAKRALQSIGKKAVKLAENGYIRIKAPNGRIVLEADSIAVIANGGDERRVKKPRKRKNEKRKYTRRKK